MPLLLLLVIIASSAACAADKPVKVELQNPGFEEELKGWDNADQPELTGVFSLDNDLKHGGKASLHIQPQTPDQWPWISQQVPAIEPGAFYVLKAWQQGGMEPNTSTCGAVRIDFQDEAGQSVGSRVGRRRLMMQQWVEVGLEAQAPLTTKSAVIHLRLMGETEAWFDDVELLRTRPAPALTLSPARLALKPDEAKTVAIQVLSAAELPADATAEIKLLDPKDKPVAGVTGQLARQDGHTLAGDMALPGLSAGRYRWEAKIGANTAGGVVFVAAPVRPKNLSDRGVLLQADGRPVFPIGMYHASLGDYQALAEQGFKVVQGLGAHDKRLLNQCAELAKTNKLLVEFPLHIGGGVGANFPASQEKLNTFKKSPVVMSWKLADEPDQHPEVADEIPDVYARLRQKDAQRPLLLTVLDPATCEYWAHFCDSLQIVAFPLPDQPPGAVAGIVRQARAALAPWQHLSVLLPAGWRMDNGCQPSFEQARLMVYLAVIGGARGIWWYAMRDPGWELMQTPLWSEFRRLNKETAALGDVAINGADMPLQSDNDQLQIAAWKGGDRLAIAVANTTAQPLTALLRVEGLPEQMHAAHGQALVEVAEGALRVTVPPGGAALLLPGPPEAAPPAVEPDEESGDQPEDIEEPPTEDMQEPAPEPEAEDVPVEKAGSGF